MPRKVPYSAKRKKQQLRDRRERKRGDAPAGPAPGPGGRSGSHERGGDGPPGDPPSEPAGPPRRHDPNRFRLQLGGPRAEAVERSRRRAQEEPLEPLPESALELDPHLVYGPGLTFPRRPPWTFGMSPQELRAREEAAFGAFLEGLGDIGDPPGDPPGDTPGDPPKDTPGVTPGDTPKDIGDTPGDTPKDIGDTPGDTPRVRPGLAPFEHNLETWRQLWRVLDMSDIILLIADARHPALGVPPALLGHVTQDLGKGLILILNKVDLTPPPVAVAWTHLFREHLGVTHVVPFTSAPASPAQPGVQKRQKKRGGRWGRAVGPRQLLGACEELVGGAVDLSAWRARLERAEQRPEEGEESEEEGEEPPEPEGGAEEEGGAEDEAPPRKWERFRHGVLTLGCVGLPNAGKSSVLNSLLGRSAVGVSRAPGRTRYFQTHYLSATVRLCDCPGLVFPSRAPPELQVLAGVYPISQVQDPYSAVGFLGSRLDLPRLLQLRPPSGPGWTAWEICEAWAEKRGYKTARTARNDAARAANAILRLAAEGRLRLCTTPPGYGRHREKWEEHPDTAAMAALTGGGAAPQAPPSSSEEEDEEEEESDEATPPPSHAHNPFALLGEDEC